MCFEFDYWVTTDGEALSNGTAESTGYGSYHLESRTGQKQTIWLDFGRGVTNNQAEYQTLIVALKDLVGASSVRASHHRRTASLSTPIFSAWSAR